ncbi:amidase [Starkeya sp. ORNL1]|nr:amidase [Starkeya sp. ORNL1]
MPANSPASPPADPFGAFCTANHVAQPGAAQGALHGLSFAAKDVFDVTGSTTGFGHPTWLASHEPATETATAVTRLLDAGADLIGRTISDELCYSLSGENSHYGTPTNPRNPDRLPGGSSSGSAVAVAGGLVDFAVGTDCGGSVRVPASYCGLFGLRPTHGSIPLTGVSRFAPRFDTIGWFARDAAMLKRISDVLLGDSAPAHGFRRMVLADDAFERTDPAIRAAIAPALDAIERRIGAHERAVLSPEGLDHWLETFRIAQAGEIWASLGAWIGEHRPSFGRGVGERFAIAATIAPDAALAARARADEIAVELAGRFSEDELICLPTTPTLAPPRGTASNEVEIDYRRRTMELLCTAGLGGLPQLTIPVATVDGAPVGLSIMARRGNDKALLQLAKDVFG